MTCKNIESQYQIENSTCQMLMLRNHCQFLKIMSAFDAKTCLKDIETVTTKDWKSCEMLKKKKIHLLKHIREQVSDMVGYKKKLSQVKMGRVHHSVKDFPLKKCNNLRRIVLILKLGTSLSRVYNIMK